MGLLILNVLFCESVTEDGLSKKVSAGLGTAVLNIQEFACTCRSGSQTTSVEEQGPLVSPPVVGMSDPHGRDRGFSSALADAVRPIASNVLVQADSNAESQSNALPLQVEGGKSKDPLSARNKPIASWDVKKVEEGTDGTVG